jgi:MFS transporter, DHA1 family, multidrug resistance protein
VTSTPIARRTRRAALVVLFLSFVDVFALLPTVAPFATSLGAGPAMLGLIVGAYSLTNLPANVVGGVLLDRWGRRRVLLLGLALAAATVALYPLAGTPGQLLAARLAHGVAGGILVPAVFTVAGDRSEVGATGRVMGRLGAAIGAAAVVAPAGAGVLRQAAGTSAVFLTVSGLLVLGLAFAVVGVHETPSSDGGVPPPPAVPRVAGGMRELLATPGLRRVLAAVIAMTAAVGVLAAFLPGLVEGLGAAPAATGGLFTLYALVAAGLMLSPAAGSVDRAGPARPAAAGLLALAVALALLALGALPLAIVASAVFGLGYGLVFPAVSGAVSIAATPANRGRAFGLFNAAFSVGLAAGPTVTGALTQRLPAIDPFLVPALVCLAVATWTLLRGRKG